MIILFTIAIASYLLGIGSVLFVMWIIGAAISGKWADGKEVPNVK